MVKAAYIDKNGFKKGAWSEEEDNKLRAYIQRYGHWNWRLLPQFAGLQRCGKSCRLRWMNYLKPGVKRGDYTQEERHLIAKLHQELGNKWSAIASKLPGRTDNDIKNYWHAHLSKSRKRTSKSGPGQQEEQSSQVSHCKNFEQVCSGRDVTCADPKLSSRKPQKSQLSSDIFVSESSNSNLASGVVDPDSYSSAEQNSSELILSGLDPLSMDSAATDDSSSFSDLLSGFHESFWTQPFMVDTYSYDNDYYTSLFDEGGLLSPQLSCFDDNAINMY